MKILIVAPAWVGDMVMAHCLVSLLQQPVEPADEPDHRVTVDLLAPPATEPLGRRMPGVRQTWLLDVGHGELGWAARRRLARQLAGEGYDQAIVLPNSFKSALIPWWAGITRRTGWHGEARYVLLNDRRRLDPDRYPLMIERFMALGLAPGTKLAQPYPVPALTADPARAEVLRSELELDASPATVLCPGAEFGPAKRWPAAHYAAVARHQLEAGHQVWLLGTAGDAQACGEIAAAAPGVVDLAGRTSLLDAVDLIGQADQVVCNDSGLMHVACALGVPVVAVFGSTSPSFTPPLGPAARVVRNDLPCSPCFERECPLGHLRCLTELEPRRVIEAVARVA